MNNRSVQDNKSGTGEIRRIIETVSSAHSIQCLWLSEDSAEADLERLDFSFRRNHLKDYTYTDLFRELTSHVTLDTIDDMEDHYRVHYMVFALSEEADSSTAEYGILGPFLGIAPGSQHFLYPADWDTMNEQYHNNLRTYYETIPVIRDLQVWFRLLRSFLSDYRGHTMSIRIIAPGQSSVELRNLDVAVLEPYSSASYELMEMRYATENELMDAIASADMERAIALGRRMRENFTFDIGNLQLTKDLMITSNTLFRKAVERACVAPLYLDSLSMKIIYEVEGCDSPLQLEYLFLKMIRRYCMLVQSYSREGYPDLIRRVMGYIDFHYAEQIALSSIAAYFSVSKNYLSGAFHRSVGMTLTEYINQVRMRHALQLLNTTDAGIREISEVCGFTDTNYFTRTYKKTYGMTPQAYRKMIGHSVSIVQ